MSFNKTMLVVALVFLLQLVSCQDQRETAKIILSKTVDTFIKGLDFYQQNIAEMNLDAVYALRIAEGVFERTLETLDTHRPTINKPIDFQWMKSLKSRTTALINQAVPYLRVSDYEYFKQVGFVVKNKWRIVRSFRKLVRRESNVTIKDVKSKVGDNMQSCMEAIHGSSGSAPCNITNTCWYNMTRLDGYGYTLTHQILYFMFGQHVHGCTRVMNTKLSHSNISGGVEHMYEALCTAIYPQMLMLETLNDQDLKGQLMDLYYEDALVCGILGYQDFLSISRLDKLIKRQFPSGCYGDEEYNPKMRDEMNLMPHLYRRKAKQLGGGCESHVTGVSTGLLSVYIRWLTLTMAQSQTDVFSSPEIDLN